MIKNPEYLKKFEDEQTANDDMTLEQKLKLLNSLVKSRGYCLANDIMTKGNNLSPLCEKADSTQEIIERINILMVDSPACNNIKSRQKILSSIGYNDIYNIINK